MEEIRAREPGGLDRHEYEPIRETYELPKSTSLTPKKGRRVSYKQGLKKYGFAAWHVLILLIPIIFAAMSIAKIMQTIGNAGARLESMIRSI